MGRAAVRAVFAFLIGAPFAAVGVLLTASMWLAPIGLPFLFLAGYPLFRVIRRYLDETWAWDNRPRVLDEGADIPWVVE